MKDTILQSLSFRRAQLDAEQNQEKRILKAAKMIGFIDAMYLADLLTCEEFLQWIAYPERIVEKKELDILFPMSV